MRRRRLRTVVPTAVALVAAILCAAWPASDPDALRASTAAAPRPAIAARIRADVGVPQPQIVAAASEGDARLVVRGRVVDGVSRPVADAAVSVETRSGPCTATTDAMGSYRLDIARPPLDRNGAIAFCVRAADALGRGGFRHMWLRASTGREASLPDVVLEAAGRIAVLVRDAQGPVPGANVVLEPWVDGQSPLAATTTDNDGMAQFDAIPNDLYQVRAWADGRGYGGADRLRPADPPTNATVLLAARDVRVAVLRRHDSSPVSGAQVLVGAQGSAVTDPPVPIHVAPTGADGRTDVRGVAPGTLLRVSTNGHLAADGAMVGATDDEMTLYVDVPHRAAWRLVAGDAAPPPDGAVLRIVEPPGPFGAADLPRDVRVANGEVSFDTIADRFLAYAVADDGATAQLWARQTAEPRYPDAVCRRGRRLSIRLLDETGEPIALRLLTASGCPPGDSAGTTDASGRVVLGPLTADSIDRSARAVVILQAGPGDPLGSLSLGRFDVPADGLDAEYRLRAPVELLLRVRVDGVPALPGGWSVRAARAGVRMLREDAARGELDVALVPETDAEEPFLLLSAPGFPEQRVALPWSVGTRPMQADFEFLRGATIRALCDAGVFGVELQHRDAQSGRWERANLYDAPHGSADGARPDRDGRVVVTGLPPGRYRFADLSGQTSEPVDLAAGETSAEISIGTRTASVTGRIVMPDGAPFDGRGRVVVDGEGLDRTPALDRGAHLEPDGSFIVIVPAERRVVLSVAHPDLVPDPVAGRVEVLGAKHGVELRLARGAVAMADVPATAGLRGITPARVELRRADGAGPPVSIAATVQDGRLRFTGHAPAVYSMWIDVPGFAPATLDRVDLTSATSSIGAIDLRPGLTLRLSVAGRRTSSVNALIRVTSASGPAYTRTANVPSGGSFDVSGLAPGRFAVQVLLFGAAPRTVERTFDLADADALLDLE